MRAFVQSAGKGAKCIEMKEILGKLADVLQLQKYAIFTRLHTPRVKVKSQIRKLSPPLCHPAPAQAYPRIQIASISGVDARSS